jgi:SAM-dependent methyltransferase
MASQGKFIFERLYRSAASPEDLPWYEPEPPQMLVEAMDRRREPGTALDIGCGAGTYSVYMAQRGYAVTAIDFMPQAIALLRKQIETTGLDIEAVQADVNTWTTDKAFDIVLDVGCLHTPGTIEPAHYKQQLLKWLAPGGDFLLSHVAKRAWWDCWPIGPKRVYSEKIIALFAPEIELVESRPELRKGIPLFVGGSMLLGRYWFRRVR